MTQRPADDRERLEQAAHWLLVVQSEQAKPEDFAGMLAWCDADPLNKQALERIEQTWVAVGALAQGATSPLDDAELMAADERPRAPRRRAWWQALQPHAWRFGLGAALATLAVVIGVRMLAPPVNEVEHLSAQRGTHESARLSDGSRLELGGKSSVAVLYTDSTRLVIANDGEAFYQVQRDPARPFVVRAGPVSATAVGTAFTVRRDGDTVVVVVTEGLVDVRLDAHGGNAPPSTLRAKAGEQVRYDRGRFVTARMPAVEKDPRDAWRQGRLQFVDEPLRLVVASINRHAKRELVIADGALEELRFTGTVFVSSLDAWLAGIETVFRLEVSRDGERVLLKRAQPAAS